MPEHEQPLEALVQKLSRVTLRAAEKGRKSLFDRLTEKNAEKISKLSKEKPVFFENDENAETKIELDPEIQDLLPPEFFENPTKWIEAQSNIERRHAKDALPKGEEIEELWRHHVPYDISKVKSFDLQRDKKKVLIVSKRIDPEQLEETALARGAYEAGIPTARVLGEVTHRGNRYALFERIPALSVFAMLDKHGGVDRLYEDASNAGTLASMARSRKSFDGILQQFSSKKISEEAKQNLYTLWEVERERIAIVEATLHIVHTVRNLDEDATSETAKRALRDCLYGDETIKDIDSALHFHGYRDIDHFADSLPYGDRLSQLNFGDRLEKHAREQFDAQKFRKEWRAIVEKDILGIAISDAMDALETQCEAKGIVHKDFNNRNILIEWDFTNDAPLRRKGQDPRLFVIDWEPKPKSGKGESK